MRKFEGATTELMEDTEKIKGLRSPSETPRTNMIRGHREEEKEIESRLRKDFALFASSTS